MFIRHLSQIIVLVLLAGWAESVNAQQPGTIPVIEPGYRALFNGRDLAGWEGSDAPADTCWKVENGVLTCLRQKKGPWLRTVEQFGDFNLRFDYRVEQDANSGVYVPRPREWKSSPRCHYTPRCRV